MVSKTRAAVAGIAAAAVALGLAELIAVFTGPGSAPLVAVGGVIVDSVPEPLKELAISLFGVYDKIALLTGTAVLLAVVAAFIGIGAARKRWIGYAGIGGFALVGVAAALTRPGANPLSILPTLIGSGAAVIVLFGLVEKSQEVEDEDGRRSFLKWTVAAFGGAALAGLGGRFWGSSRSAEQARSEISLPSPASFAPAAPSDPPVKGLSTYVTSNDDFYRIDTALVVPQVDPASWRLRIHGRVGKPLEITFDQLLAMPMVERYITLACVSNEVGGDLISNAKWLGVPVKDLLDRVEPDPAADQVVSRSVDGWTCGTPTAVLRDGRDALIAIGMNGEPLPVKHGFPARMVTPGLYGYVSACKWITEMELTTFGAFDAYWIRRGWAEQGPIKTQSRIDVPGDNAKVNAGEVTVAGVAWAQHRGISVVEVKVDDGAWQPVELAATVSADTWRQWVYRWQAVPGRHTISVRAADATGAVQPGDEVPIFPDGAEGWHTISVTVQ
ncbi:MAG TPA: molybdopterin-dependent oxidoreductase [Candidatus Limnocylindrales bacterium]|nr:molybdopterin-dependent oxidoreductase [Candidatus Limnocylindrales bacterium]